MKRTIRSKMLSTAFFIASLAMLAAAGCAPAIKGSSSTALMKIAEGERAIDEARHDCVENTQGLRNAERMLQKARMAFSVQEYQTAVWRAEEAAADANYARTKAALDQAEQNAQELQKSNSNLKTGLSTSGSR